MPAALDKNTMKEALKAETKIRRMRRTQEAALSQALAKWDRKVDEYVSNLAPEVRAVLRAGGVLQHVADEAMATDNDGNAIESDERQPEVAAE